MAGILERLNDFNERRYRQRIPSHVQQFVAEQGLGIPDVYIEASEQPPYFPPSARALLFGELLPDELAQELGVPVDIGRTLQESQREPRQ